MPVGTRITQTNLTTLVTTIQTHDPRTHPHDRSTTDQSAARDPRPTDGRLNSRSPGAERSPQPTQKRPPPALAPSEPDRPGRLPLPHRYMATCHRRRRSGDNQVKSLHK